MLILYIQYISNTLDTTDNKIDDLNAMLAEEDIKFHEPIEKSDSELSYNNVKNLYDGYPKNINNEIGK